MQIKIIIQTTVHITIYICIYPETSNHFKSYRPVKAIGYQAFSIIIMENKKEILKYCNNNNNNHLVLIPCPLQGHMSPMLHLAKLLHSKGFMITIILISTTHELSNPSESYPEFLFQSIDGVSPESVCASLIGGGDIMLYLFLLNEKCKAPFKDYCLLMSKLRPYSGGCFGPVSCIVYDAVMYFSADVADEVEIPRIVLRTSSASTFLALSLDQLKQKGSVAKGGKVRYIFNMQKS